MLDSPRSRLSAARCTATNEDDCPVSTVMLGPRVASTWDTRLAIIDRLTPAAA